MDQASPGSGDASFRFTARLARGRHAGIRICISDWAVPFGMQSAGARPQRRRSVRRHVNPAVTRRDPDHRQQAPDGAHILGATTRPTHGPRPTEFILRGTSQFWREGFHLGPIRVRMDSRSKSMHYHWIQAPVSPAGVKQQKSSGWLPSMPSRLSDLWRPYLGLRIALGQWG